MNELRSPRLIVNGVLHGWKIFHPSNFVRSDCSPLHDSDTWGIARGQFVKTLKAMDFFTNNTWMFPKIGGFSPKSSILIGISSINHPFWGVSLIFGSTQISCANCMQTNGTSFQISGYTSNMCVKSPLWFTEISREKRSDTWMPISYSYEI